MKIGSHFHKGNCRFSVWAPLVNELNLRTVFPHEHVYPMRKGERGYWQAELTGFSPGTRYYYDLGGSVSCPDPASNYQPDGVFGPSEVVNHSAYKWNDRGWKGFDLRQALVYELHVGTFTPEGTFSSVIQRLDELRELGVTAIELMPVAQFPGERNWGYDGTFLFAPQNSYGGPDGLKELVDACHARGLGVVLDAVYNHLGPEANVLAQFGPYFTNRCSTPWGSSINFDGPYADDVRNFIVRNALYWFYHFHVDALRLDAIQFIFDTGARHILKEITEKTLLLSRFCGRRLSLIAESDQNDARVVNPFDKGGYGLDAVWLDDFHHSLHTLLTGENTGYYADYGRISHLGKALSRGFVYSWDYSRFRCKHYGSSSGTVPSSRFIVYSQNHDQVGNRMFGERLSQLAPFEALKLSAGMIFSSAYVPMLFMGEEYAEDAPFLYFIDHSDAELVRAVAEGRKNEFRSFVWEHEPPGPHLPETYRLSKLKWEKRYEGRGKSMLGYVRSLAALRRGVEALNSGNRSRLRILLEDEERKTIVFTRKEGGSSALVCANFSRELSEIRLRGVGRKKLVRAIDSADPLWAGPGCLAPERLENGDRRVRLQPFNFIMYITGP